ncbi:MAG: hypothetical protein Q9187_003929 [Circinaria calcarea]
MVKGGTIALKKHRFESFNQRIAKLKIDPVRRARRQDVERDNLSSTASFFKAGLASWGDLNLSENFTAFIQEVEPLCDSLAQILHYQQRIMDILVKYIERADVLSLEPLLSLLGHLAHDLGTRFETHFLRAVKLITSLAAKHADVEVIEWSFACLTWLFKYLSRLLVPDLRPIYDVMAPLLGKESQKTHITRFAAGAMSFLLRKAALGYQKNTEPLNTIVRYMFYDIQAVGDQNNELYRYGIMTLFADAIKGIHRGLHSSGPTIYHCLLDQVATMEVVTSSTCAHIVYGITISLIHHTDAETFLPILDVIYDGISKLSKTSKLHPLSLYGELLFVVAVVRKGSRIGSWKPMLDSLMTLLEQRAIDDDHLSAACLHPVFAAAAVIFQYSPLDLVISKFGPTMNIMANESNRRSFVPFCIYFSELGKDRFHSLLAPYFYKFVIQNWRVEELQICSSIPVLFDGDYSPDGHTQRATMTCPEVWQQQIINTFEMARVDDNLLVQCSAYLDMLKYVSIGNTTTGHLKRILDGLINDSLSSPTSTDQRLSFSLGVALESLLRLGNIDGSSSRQLWPQLCAMVDRFGSMPIYLENLILFCEASEVDLHDTSTDILVSVLVRNLSCSVHTLRSLSIRLLCALHSKAHHRESEALKIVLIIENTPLNLQSARSASMHVRKLPAQYEAILSDPWLSKAIPYFCFGLLTFKLSQLWDDAVDVLKAICESKIGEDIVSEIAFRWLEDGLSESEETMSFKSEALKPQRLNEFQCSEFSRVKSLIEQSSQEIASAAEHLQAKYITRHRLDPLEIPDVASRALRVLLGIPHIAEKRSRRLVPLFLQWASTEQTKDTAIAAQDEDQALELGVQDEQLKHDKLGQRDRKAMLDLFSRFTNPRVLFRSSEVYRALLGLLTNGNVELQRSALKAIFTWKVEGIQPYQENLLNLLDDSRFRDEISVFLQRDSQESTIEDLHRFELMPVILRLLYGKIIARSGSTSDRRGQAAKRRAVFQALSRFPNGNLQEFVHICLGPLGNFTLLENSFKVENMCPGQLAVRKQLGLVNMMNDMLETLGSQLAFLGQPIANAVMYCMTQSSQDRVLESHGTGLDNPGSSQLSLLKDIRQVGLHCLKLLFQNCPTGDLQPFLPAIFEDVLNPRLEKLPIETAQSVSGMLRLFSVWASSPEMCFFLTQYNTSLMNAVIDCLEVPSAKDEVKLFVINSILKQLISLVNPKESRELNTLVDCQLIQAQVLSPHVDHILAQAGSLLRKSPSKDLLGATISLVSQMAPIVTGTSQIENLLEVSTFLLDQPAQRVNPKSKGDLLRVIQHFVPLVALDVDEALQQHLYDTVSSLFGYFKDRVNRVILSEVLSTLAQHDKDLVRVADLCIALNSFSSQSIDEPDFDKRLVAFNSINEVEYKSFSLKEWKPLVYNMLFYIKDNEELAIRSNASFTLRRFVETTPMISTTSTSPSGGSLLKQVLLPSIRSGALERSELVRTEYLAAMAHLIRKNPGWSEISDMVVLLVNDDEEASFFSNILHIQQHRRLRALRRLATNARHGHLRSANIAHFLIPLIEHFIFDKADDESAHNLAAEAILTIGALAEWLEWPQLRAMFRRFSGYVQSKPDLEKTTIKLLGVVIDALGIAGAARQQRTSPASPQEVDDDIDIPSGPLESQAWSTLSITLPGTDKLTDDLIKNLLPPLVSYLHEKDESKVSLRVPMAISIVRLLKLLPPEQLAERLPPILTDVCHILRSRAQESRDMTRKTLVEIATLVGPSCFGFILKELRGSLARGYQLHVLSYTVHSILVATAPIFKPGDLDYCLPQIVSVIMDDIFGATGQEKDAEEYISKMKEVKSSKSYDSMELVAKTTTIARLSSLVKPLQTLMGEKLDLRMVKKIDELLRRIGVGLLRNEIVQSREVLIFCFEIIRDASKLDTDREKKTKEDYRVKRFLVSSKGSNAQRGTSNTYEYKLARFALDILRSVLHKFDTLQTPSNLSGFIPVIENALLQSQEEVQISAIRLLATIIKVPLKVIDENGVKYVSEAVKIIKETTSTNTEIAQAALKLVSAVLRERQNVTVEESDIAYLLQRLKPDLDEPDRQGVTFNFLKAVMARKIIIPEIYETLETIAAIMVTNQTQGTRDLARGVYFQFLLSYPQSKDRLAKQLGFLVKNLDYKHIEGRQSVMEAVHLLLSKVGDNLVQELVGTFFVPLMMVIVNDDSHDCRRMAGELLKELFERADSERTQQVLSMLKTWLNQDENTLLTRISLQIYGIYLDVQGVKGESEALLLKERIIYFLKKNLSDFATADWEVLYFALQAVAKLCQTFQNIMFKSSSAPLWLQVRECLYFPHAWVKLAAVKLLGIYFADFARNNAATEQPERPLRGSSGLRLGDEEMIKVINVSFRILRIPSLSEELATQCGRNLIFLGRFIGATKMVQSDPKVQPLNGTSGDQEDDDEEFSELELDDRPDKSALQYIFERLSAILRREPGNNRAPSLIPKTASLQIMAALCNHLPLSTLAPLMEIILLPLQNLTDPTIAAPYSSDEGFRTAYGALVSSSQEIMSLLQQKLGTTEYIMQLTKVKEGVKERREGRRVKRRIEAVSQPEKMGKEKKRKGEKKREKRKERSGEERGRRRGW